MVSCSFFETAVELLLSEKHNRLLRHYYRKLEKDPHFLVYHRLSITTRLRRELVLETLGPQVTPHCFDQTVNDCHIIDALEEALKRYAAVNAGASTKTVRQKEFETAASGE